MENNKRYLMPSEFNTTLVLNELRNIVKEKGGYILRDLNTPLTIIECHEVHTGPWEKDKRVSGQERKVECYSYFQFELEGMYYYVQKDSNPFFPWEYIKTPISADRTYSLDAYLDELDNEKFVFDRLFSINCPKEVIRESAEILFGILVNLKPCGINVEYEKVYVPNMYDGGSHKEIIPVKERRKVAERIE